MLLLLAGPSGDSSFIGDLAIVLGVAAATGIICNRLRLPAMLGYLLAGLIVGPYLPVPLFADPERVEALSEFGVVFVMFAVGLEFRIGRLIRLLPISGVTGLVEIGCLLWSGFTLAQLLGWNTVDSIFLGASIAISSTMIVSKVFDQQAPSPDVREFVFGLLVIQDVAAIAMIAALTGLVAGGGLSPSELALTLGELGLVLFLLLAGGMLIFPRIVRTVDKFRNPESTVILVSGICFGLAYLAQEFGYSVALGAFIAGILVSESGRGHRIEHLIAPLKNLFAAIFFVSIGMTVNPALAYRHLGLSLIVFLLVVTVQFLSVTVAGILSGNGIRRSVVAGMALGQIGEFAFIMAAIGLASGQVRPELQPILVTVAVLSTFSTPFMLAFAERVSQWVDHLMPHRAHVLLSVYEAWFERLRKGRSPTEQSPLRRLANVLALDALALVALALVALIWLDQIRGLIRRQLSVESPQDTLVLAALLILLAGPFIYGLIRNTLALSSHMVEQVFSSTSGAPSHRILRLAVGLLVLGGGGIPAVALVRPFLPAAVLAPAVVIGGAILLYLIWTAARDFEGEVESGSEQILDVLAGQSGAEPDSLLGGDLLPGLDELPLVEIEELDYARGKTLAEIDLRALSGATVIAIHRNQGATFAPSGEEQLQAGDRLALCGSAEANRRARSILNRGSASPA